MSLDHVGQSSAQAKQYLLCHDCEQRFSRCAEKWVAANCYDPRKTTFRLRENLEKTPSIFIGPQGGAYDASKTPGIEIEKLAYFSASVIWRASLRTWRLQKQVYEPIKIAPKCQEELRLYLRGGQAPQSAVFSVHVISTTIPPPLVLFPEILDPDSLRVIYRFYIPGIWFLLTLGEGVSSEDRAMCILHSASHPICLSSVADTLPGLIVSNLYMSRYET